MLFRSRRLADLATNILTLNRVESQTILTDKACFSLDEQLRQLKPFVLCYNK